MSPGETLALVGASGSGKSTICPAAAALLRPRRARRSGSAGTTCANSPSTSLRAAIGLVPEDSFLFSDTVRANIAYGRPDATDEEIIAAARAAQAHDSSPACPTATTPWSASRA